MRRNRRVGLQDTIAQRLLIIRRPLDTNIVLLPKRFPVFCRSGATRIPAKFRPVITSAECAGGRIRLSGARSNSNQPVHHNGAAGLNTTRATPLAHHPQSDGGKLPGAFCFANP